MKEAKREAEDVIKGVRAEKEKAFQATAVPVRARTSPNNPSPGCRELTAPLRVRVL